MRLLEHWPQAPSLLMSFVPMFPVYVNFTLHNAKSMRV